MSCSAPFLFFISMLGLLLYACICALVFVQFCVIDAFLPTRTSFVAASRFNRCRGVASCEAVAADTTDVAPAPLLTETVSFMEIRVGKIVEIALHPEAENLYVEKVDCGEEGGPRTIVSGLAKFCTIEELMGRNVVVLANLKPRALVGILSAGMLLCASNEDHTKACYQTFNCRNSQSII